MSGMQGSHKPGSCKRLTNNRPPPTPPPTHTHTSACLAPAPALQLADDLPAADRPKVRVGQVVRQAPGGGDIACI